MNPTRLNSIIKTLRPSLIPHGEEGKQVQKVFAAVCQLTAQERAEWFVREEVEASIREQVEELLRYDGHAEAEAFFSLKPGTVEHDDLIGTTVGPYTVLRLIGRGGMASVYHARRTAPYEQDVAIKVADVRLGSWSARFDEERQVLADLHHPGIARLLDGGVLPDHRPYLVMEYVPGQHLDTYADLHKLRVKERVGLWLQVCKAVASAHARGIIHRDLKPSNILVANDQRVVVVDFGLARRWEQQSGLTRTAMVLGTPDYMAPEQATGKKGETTPATDVYALGAVLYTLLTGRPPFRSESPLQMVTMLLREEPVLPRKLNPAVSRDLETICLKCLEKEPGRRYATAALVAADVERLQRGEPIHARAICMSGRAWRWARHRPLVASVLGLLVITIVTSLIIVANHWRRANAALELAKQATSQLFAHTIELKHQPVMQRSQLDLLSKTIASNGKLVHALEDETLFQLYFKARHELVCAYLRVGNMETGKREAEQLLEDIDAYAEEHPSEELSLVLVNCLTGKCATLSGAETLQEQRELITRAQAILAHLSQKHPEKHSLTGLLAEMLSRLANIEVQMQLDTDAEKHFQQSIEIFKHLHQLYAKDDPLARIRYSRYLANYADFLYRVRGNRDLGRRLTEEAALVDQSLQADFPDHLDYRDATYTASAQYARILHVEGEWTRAYQQYDELKRLFERLMKLYPDVTSHYYRYAINNYHMAELAFAMKKMEEARVHFALGNQMYVDLIRKHGIEGIYVTYYSMQLANCPVTELRHPQRALEISEQYLKPRYSDPQAWLNHGVCHLRQGNWREAESALLHAMTLKPTDDEVGMVHIYLALTYANLGQSEKARQAYAASERYVNKYPKDVEMMRLRNEVQQLMDRK